MKIYWYLYHNSSVFIYLRHFYLYVLKIDRQLQIIALILLCTLIIIMWRKYKLQQITPMQVFARVILPVYIFILVSSLVLSRDSNVEMGINIIPFWTERAIISGETKYIRTLIYNLIMLVPYGALLPIAKKSYFLKTLIGGSLISLSIELLQLLTKTGLCELDDVIHNTIGVIIGYGIWKLAVWIKQKYITRQIKD